MDVWTLLLLVVALVGGYFIYIYFVGKSKAKDGNASDEDIETDDEPYEEIEKKEFTLEELAKHTTSTTKIYVSLKGIVYNVTDSGFYGPDQQYSLFAGKDASYNLAKMSFEPSTLNRLDLSGLKRSEIEQLDEYVELYNMKYDEVGWLKEWKKEE